MKTILKIAIATVFLGFTGLQFFRPERTNPQINENEVLNASVEVSKEIEAILKRSCNDCHSNATVYPWYSNIAPISWRVVEHIEEARGELNFSKWGTYGKDRQERKLEEICEEVEARNMPHNQYLWIHWDAKLSESDIKSLCDWSKASIEKLKETDGE